MSRSQTERAPLSGGGLITDEGFAAAKATLVGM